MNFLKFLYLIPALSFFVTACGPDIEKACDDYCYYMVDYCGVEVGGDYETCYELCKLQTENAGGCQNEMVSYYECIESIPCSSLEELGADYIRCLGEIAGCN